MTFIAASSPDRPFATAHLPTTSTRLAAPGLASLFALACFLPYPALSLGKSTGLQISQVLALAFVPGFLLRAPGRTLVAFVLLMIPPCLSGFVNALREGTADPDVLVKEIIALALAFGILWPSSTLADPRRFRSVLLLVAGVTLFHALVGLYQVYSFTNDEFPLLWLYRNPSFKPMDLWAETYARYIKRPCGLFPEPSAMAASLGPWLVLLVGLLNDPDPPPALRLTRRDRRLVAAASAAGFVLLALSRSGSSLAIMAAVLVVVAFQSRRLLRSITPATALTLALLLASVVGVVGYVVTLVGGDLDARVESSWGLRGLSIVTGLTANTAPLDLAFGVGPGQSTPIIGALLAGVPRPDDQADMAIWSLTVSYYMENGLVGALAMAIVLAMSLRAIARSSAIVLGLGGLAAWLTGVAVTTSYMPLSAVWLFLGALLQWDRIFPHPSRGEDVP